jgi:hypothetical protein
LSKPVPKFTQSDIQRVLKLRFEDKLKFPEIAQMYGLTTDAFRYRLNRVPEYVAYMEANHAYVYESRDTRRRNGPKVSGDPEKRFMEAMAGRRYTDHPKAQWDGGKGSQSAYTGSIFSNTGISHIYGQH